jgi:hypothetical protein
MRKDPGELLLALPGLNLYVTLLAAKVRGKPLLFENVTMIGSAEFVQNSHQGFGVFRTTFFRAAANLSR